MSWFKDRTAFENHMKYRALNPNRYVVVRGTNKHPDHSTVLSTNLSLNQELIDTLFYQIMSVLPCTTFSLPQSIEITFDNDWEEHKDNDCSVIGVYLTFTLSQFGKEIRKGRVLLTNWGNRGEPASVYDDAFSRFLIFEILKGNSSSKYEGLTQYGFHKFLNAKYKKLLTDYKVLGVKKEIKPTILRLLQNTFKLKVTADIIILPSVEINKDNDEQLIFMLQQLIVIGLVKEHCRGRLGKLKI